MYNLYSIQKLTLICSRFIISRRVETTGDNEDVEKRESLCTIVEI